MFHDNGESKGFSMELESNHGFNPFESIVHQTYEPGSTRVFMDMSASHGHHHDLPGLEIIFDDPFHSRKNSTFDSPLYTTEVMNTLDRHAAFINVGKDSEHITRKELENYLKHEGRFMDPRDKADLMEVLVNFDNIAAADGRSRGKGISSNDVDAVLLHEERRERNMLELASWRGEGSWNQRPRNDSNEHQHKPDAPQNQKDGVITEKRADHNGHYFVEGNDIPLSQEEFKRHYGIPQDVDLLKYMPGKANDGNVTKFWDSPVSGGLGGRLENGNLKWEDPNYHSLKYDFSRNFAQVFNYSKGMSEDQAKEFAFNFARTQQAVFKANGFDLKQVDNEKVFSAGEGSEGWTDFVQDVGGKDSKINW